MMVWKTGSRRLQALLRTLVIELLLTQLSTEVWTQAVAPA